MSARLKKILHTLLMPPLSYLRFSYSLSLRPSARSLCCLYGGGASWGSVGLTGWRHVRGNGKKMEKERFGKVCVLLDTCVCACAFVNTYVMLIDL